MPIEALIVDVDGTLADTEEAHRVAFNLAFERYRLGWTWPRGEYRDLLHITGGKERIAHYLERLPVDATQRSRLRALVPDIHAEKTRFYSSVVGDGAVPLREGVARLLDEARRAGCRLAIASTTTAVNVDTLIRTTLGVRAGDVFEAIVCGDAVAAKKPAPDVYLKVLEKLRLAPARAVALEDSGNGLRAAVAAGLWTVVTPNYWTESHDFAQAGLLLPRLGEPDRPLDGEPGHQLESAAWLTFDELARRAERGHDGVAPAAPRAPGSDAHALHRNTAS